MKDLTPTQVRLMEKLYSNIAEAKLYDTYADYVKATYQVGHPDWQEKEIKEERYKQNWTNELNDITLSYASSLTIKALEKKGYIEIIIDGGLANRTFDTVKVVKFQ